MELTSLASAAAAAAGSSYALLRWLRVSQREHYHAGRNLSVAGQWAKVQTNQMVPLLAGAALAGFGFTGHALAPLAIAGAAGIAAFTPWSMPVCKTDQKLKFTSRVKRLTATAGVLCAATLAARPDGALLAVAGLAAPAVVDLAALIMKPVEKQLAMKFVKQASKKLEQLDPEVVAITGSYGKTTTKNYTARLLREARQTLPTPGSFNNLMGLTRSVNEHMQPGTEVFVAEMGTYGVGEIRELCQYFPPKVAAIVSIGEAHLERMGSRETIVKAKSEILENADTWVLNVDTPELADVADKAPGHVKVVRVSATTTERADISVLEEGDELVVFDSGKEIARFTPVGSVHAVNVAVAVAIAREEGVPPTMINAGVNDLPVVASRGVSERVQGGVTIIDDTFNSNPTGAAAALEAAAEQVSDGSTLWVVTPGMFELGSAAYERNRDFAASVFAVPGAQLVAVGGSNKRAFADAAAQAGAADRMSWFSIRPAAVEHVMGKAGDGDVVLYENDRPDHLP